MGSHGESIWNEGVEMCNVEAVWGVIMVLREEVVSA
jgi:hypothetical protein